MTHLTTTATITALQAGLVLAFSGRPFWTLVSYADAADASRWQESWVVAMTPESERERPQGAPAGGGVHVWAWPACPPPPACSDIDTTLGMALHCARYRTLCVTPPHVVRGP